MFGRHAQHVRRRCSKKLTCRDANPAQSQSFRNRVESSSRKIQDTYIVQTRESLQPFTTSEELHLRNRQFLVTSGTTVGTLERTLTTKPNIPSSSRPTNVTANQLGQAPADAVRISVIRSLSSCPRALGEAIVCVCGNNLLVPG